MPPAAISSTALIGPLLERLRRPKPLRVMLLAMALALVLPAFGFTAYLVVRAAATQRAQVDQSLLQVAADLANDIDREFDRMFTLLDTLALSQRLATRDFQGFHIQATGAVRRLGANILVVDPAGRQLVNTRLPYGTPLPPMVDLTAIDAARASQSPTVSNLMYSPVANQHAFSLLMPLAVDGLAGHVLILAVDADHLTGILQGLKLPSVWMTGITDRNGVIVARSQDAATYVGKPLPGYLLDASRSASGVIATINVDGNQTYRAVARSKSSGWLVSANVRSSTVNAETRRSELTLTLGGLALLVLAGGLASLFARWIIGPVEVLAQAAAALAARAIPPVLATPVLEANAVAAALRAAAIELKARTASLRESEQRLILAQRTARLTHVDADLTTQVVVASETFEEIFGFRLPDGDTSKVVQALVERVHPEDRKRVGAAQIAASLAVGTYAYEFRIVRPNGDLRWISAHGETFGDDAGNPMRMIGTNLDITHRKEQDEHIRFLLREVSHRSKNLLAIIQAMATQTARSSRTFEAFHLRFSQRLQAMSASHDLLVNQNWVGVGIAELVRAHLQPFAEEAGGRLKISGPDLLLKPDAAQSLGLALHELATNATKYGALSVASGRIGIAWTVDRDADPARFAMTWHESDGPIVAPPQQKGFGHTVFARMVGQALGATVDVRYPPEGFIWRLEANLAAISGSLSTEVGSEQAVPA